MKYLIPTIDVEAIRTLSRLGDFDKLIMGDINGYQYGVPEILRILKEYNSSATFYIDYAETDHGEDKLKLVSELVKSSGSDVQLHIHPQFIADKNRPLLNQYSLEEQRSIFEETVTIFNKVNKENPHSFRAGGYSANDDTLRVLKEFNIKVDSSYFDKHQWCKISSMQINKISEKDGIVELPITVFNNRISYKLFGVELKTTTRLTKLDIDNCSKEELQKGLDSLGNNNVEFIILFLHSYSFLKWDYNYNNFKPDFKDINKFKYILDYASLNGYKITSVKNITDKLIAEENTENSIPTISTDRSIIKSSLKTISNRLRKKMRGS